MNGNFLGHNDDAVSISPQLHTVLFEDEMVRVVKLVFPPAAKEAMHWHPRSVSYILSPGKVRHMKSDRTVTEAKLTTGIVTSSPERLHAVENVGESTVEIVQIEFKS